MVTTTNKDARNIVALGAIFALLSVAAGAFGAHGLQGRVSEHQLDVFQTAARYQAIHALGLILSGLIGAQFGQRLLGPTRMFVVGIVIFCGTLYGIALGGPRWLGAITPFGGASFMIGWALLAWSMWKPSKVRPGDRGDDNVSRVG